MMPTSTSRPRHTATAVLVISIAAPVSPVAATGETGAALVSLTPAPSRPAAPNLVFIMADQWRGTALGCLGTEPVRTPHLDRLASEGLHFTDAVSSYPVSSPARGMLMTGRYPLGSRVTGNCNSDTAPYGVELPTESRCWSDVLSEHGYELGYIGKWHLDAPRRPYVDTRNNRGRVAWNEWCPPERRHGFGYWLAYGTYDDHLRPMYWTTDAPRDSFHYVDQWGPEFEADRAVDYIRNEGGRLRDPQKPFALVVSMNPPHTGYELVPQRYKDFYRDLDVEALCAAPVVPPRGTRNGDYFRRSVRDYYACMTGVDEQVGRIVAELERAGLTEQTLVIFTSDHGDCMGMHDHVGKNVCYDEAMRVPMILRWPGTIEARRDTTAMPAFADLGPTMLSLMGLEAYIPAEVETYDWARYVMKPGTAAPTAQQPYYFVQPARPETGMRGWRTPRYTFAVRADGKSAPAYILFDRQTDPWQLRNAAADCPDVVRTLTQQLKDWLRRTDDPFVRWLEAEEN